MCLFLSCPSRKRIDCFYKYRLGLLWIRRNSIANGWIALTNKVVILPHGCPLRVWHNSVMVIKFVLRRIEALKWWYMFLCQFSQFRVLFRFLCFFAQVHMRDLNLEGYRFLNNGRRRHRARLWRLCLHSFIRRWTRAIQTMFWRHGKQRGRAARNKFTSVVYRVSCIVYRWKSRARGREVDVQVDCEADSEVCKKYWSRGRLLADVVIFIPSRFKCKWLTEEGFRIFAVGRELERMPKLSRERDSYFSRCFWMSGDYTWSRSCSSFGEIESRQNIHCAGFGIRVNNGWLLRWLHEMGVVEELQSSIKTIDNSPNCQVFIKVESVNKALHNN